MNSLKQQYSKIMMGAALSMTLISNSFAELPNPGMQIEPGRTAVVITDPQNDFLSPRVLHGVWWVKM